MRHIREKKYKNTKNAVHTTEYLTYTTPCRLYWILGEMTSTNINAHNLLHTSEEHQTQFITLFESARLSVIGRVGFVLSMSTFGVAIGFICQTMSLSERENSIFSNRSTKTTSGNKEKEEKKRWVFGLTWYRCITNSFQVARTWIRLTKQNSTFQYTVFFWEGGLA